MCIELYYCIHSYINPLLMLNIELITHNKSVNMNTLNTILGYYLSYLHYI
jgi:hypothetical protein